ncbi:MAG: hypothetical protein V4722_14495 [Bacteroidota bacterium]
MKKPLTVVKKVFIVYAVILILFPIGNFIIGGSADGGKIENHKYYVGGNKNGIRVFTEVSKATFTYSQIHMWVLFVVTPILLIAIIRDKVLNRKKKAESTST